MRLSLRSKSTRTSLLGFLILLGIPVWINVIAPFFYRLPPQLNVSSNVVSYDNFYDQEAEAFEGEQQSVTEFSYKTVFQNNTIARIENTFDVETLSGDHIVSIRREYIVEPNTGAHIATPGEVAARSGYLFAPRMRGPAAFYDDKETFQYWHVNYNTAFDMEFLSEEELYGLLVYKYEANTIVDQTDELSGLDGVGDIYGMKLYVKLTLYIEPYTGSLVSYQDQADAFFVDIQTKQELWPWNSFRNEMDSSSAEANATTISLQKQIYIVVGYVVPTIIAVIGFLFILHRVLLNWFGLSRTLEAPTKRRKIVLPLIVATTLVGVTILVAWAMQNILDQQRRAEFESEARQHTSDIENRLSIYRNMLEGVVGLFSASESVSRTEWGQYVDSVNIDDRYPGVQGVGYAIRVPSSTQASFISSVQAEGFPEFTITPEPGDREEVTSIVYLEPFDERNQRAFGYDMYSEVNRRLAMSYARDSGDVGLSPRITLLQEFSTDVQAGFLMYLAVYDPLLPTQSVSERRRALLGYVYSPFRAGDFMRGVLLKHPTILGMTLYDGVDTSQEGDTILFKEDRMITSPSYTFTDTIQLGNRQWTIIYEAPPNFGLDIIRRMIPLALLILGLGFSGFMFFALYTTAFQRDKALLIAHDMTKDLSKLKAEAETRAAEAERLNSVMVDREYKMIELKKQIDQLEKDAHG